MLINPSDHWRTLHSYSTIHWDNWSRAEAQLFMVEWTADIANLDIPGCRCSAKWQIALMHHPVLYIDAHWFSIWTFRAHNHVNQFLDKPQFELAQATAMFGWRLQ